MSKGQSSALHKHSNKGYLKNPVTDSEQFRLLSRQIPLS